MPQIKITFCSEQMQNLHFMEFIHTMLKDRVNAEVFMCKTTQLTDPVQVKLITRSDRFVINDNTPIDILDPDTEPDDDDDDDPGRCGEACSACHGYDVIPPPRLFPPTNTRFQGEG